MPTRARVVAILGAAIFCAGCDELFPPTDGGVTIDGALFGDAGPPRACGACFVPCQEMTSGQSDPGFYLLAADDAGLVWSSGVGPVHFFAQAAGAAVPVLLASDTLVHAAAADRASIYWMSGVSAGGEVAYDRVLAAPRAGGSSTLLAMTLAPNLQGVLTQDDSFLYFVDGAGPTRAIERVSKQPGGALTTVVAGHDATAAVVDAAGAGGTTIYFADLMNETARAWSQAIPGGAASPLATIGFTRVLEQDAAQLYFADGDLMTLPKIGGQVLELQAGVRGPFVIAAGQVYWIDTDCTPGSSATCFELHGEVLTAPLAPGATPRVLCSGRITPWNLALNGKYLYVADQASGQILRLTAQ
jgi:hypothetical protein